MGNHREYMYLIIKCLFIIILISCKKNNNEKTLNNNTQSNFISKNCIARINIEDVVDTLSYKIVKLESNKESLIGNIDKLIITPDFLIVSDMNYSREVFIFNREGKFLRKIGRPGRRTGEYARLSDIAINKSNDQIILYDLKLQKMIFYNINDGSFLKEIKLYKYYGMNFSYINDSLYVFYLHYSPNSFDELLFVNNKGKLVKSSFKRKIQSIESVILNPHYFANNNSDVYFIPNYCDKIYKVKNFDKIDKIFEFNADDILLKDDDFKNFRNFNDILKLKKLIPFQRFYINNKEQFFCMSNYDNKPINFIGDVKSGNIIIFNDFAFNKNSPNKIVSSYEDYFVTVKNPLDYKNLFPEAKITNNPCLLFFKLKDFKQKKI